MKPRIKNAGRAFALLAGAFAISAPAGCFALNEGLDPPLAQLYYPTALVTSPGQHTLYVVSSDFDIQYTGGTVQAVDLDSVRRCVMCLGAGLAAGRPAEQACGDVGKAKNQSPVLYPGPCEPMDISGPVACILDNPACVSANETSPLVIGGPQSDNQRGLIRGSHIIGAFASSAVFVKNPGADPKSNEPSARLFVAVRGDPSVTYFNVVDDTAAGVADPFHLDCLSEGTEAIGGSCSPTARIGANPYESTRLLRLPTEPVGVAASDDGRAIVVAHQTGGAASLIFNDWSTKPTLDFIASGLPDSPSGIAAIPTPKIIGALEGAGKTVDYRPGFLVTLRGTPAVDMLRFYDDSNGTSRHFLQRVDTSAIATNSDGADSRSIAVDDSERRACEAGCGSDLDCLQGCLDTPLQVFVSNRSPDSMLIGRLEARLSEDQNAVTALTESLTISDMIPLTAGPSRIAVGNVLDADGRASPRVFAVSFDSRAVAIYDPRQRRIEATVHTGRGPHSLAFDITEKAVAADGTVTDPGHALLYVAHFTDSYIGAVNLDMRDARTYGSMIATIGTPTPPKDSN